MLAIDLRSISKTYHLYENGWQRLKELITRRPQGKSMYALQPLDLQVPFGQVIGLIGKNGAGKSTFLKIVAGTLQPDVGGERQIQGRVAALLELGGGFHPEMTGRENVYLSASVMGLSQAEIDARYDEIVDFSEIGEFIDRPVKTYSSGMFMRLAFAVATCVDPDILIIDEALSVGDGAFARKSFDRIMQFREANKTILFCSHSLYQIEKICDRVLWLDHGQVKAHGDPTTVLAAYSEFLNSGKEVAQKQAVNFSLTPQKHLKPETAHIVHVEASDGITTGHDFNLTSRQSNLSLKIDFIYNPSLKPPVLAVVIFRRDGLLVASTSNHNDGLDFPPNAEGKGTAYLSFEQLPLLKGNYYIDLYLLCENAIHPYEHIATAVQFSITQSDVEQGVVSLTHQWKTAA